MSYEIYGWLMVISLFTLVALLIGVTWIVALERGYDKGFKTGYKRGSIDAKQSRLHQVTITNHPSRREKQLKEDNEYLMEKVVNLWDRENK